MISLIGNALYQWDIDRKVEVFNKNIVKVSFSNDHHCDSNICGCDGSGVVTIPNKLLQSAQEIDVYGIDVEGNIIYSCVLAINSKAKPSDYSLEVESSGGGSSSGAGGGFAKITYEEDMMKIDGHEFTVNMGTLDGEAVEVLSDEDFKTFTDILKRKIVINLGDFMEIFYVLEKGYNDNGGFDYLKLSNFSGMDAFHYVSNSYYSANGGW